MVDEKEKKPKSLRKITKQRLKNIALYYLKRFESSTANLRAVLRKRVDKYAFFVPEFDKEQAYAWVDELVEEMQEKHYVDDERYANFKVKAYINVGKSQRYIQGKMRQKGISETQVDGILEEVEYDALAAAIKFAKKKKLGPFRAEENRIEFRNKDMQKMVLAGFGYDVVMEVLSMEGEE